MIEKLLRMFALENFGGDKYYPVLHGETQTTKPLALMVKRNRSIWKRPFAKLEMTILAGLEKYLKSDQEKEYLETVKSKITLEEVLEKKKDTPAFSRRRLDLDVAEIAGISVQLNDDLGDLQLGRVSQEYISDPDLRDLLANTVLDPDKMDRLEDQLLLITSVVYSERFELQGERKHEMEIDIGAEPPPQIAKILKPKVTATVKETFIPPGLAIRNVRGPILFKCCRVQYDKKTGKLKIQKGEYVGKGTMTAKGGRSETENDAEFYDTLIDLDTDETDLPDYFTADDIEKLDTIKREVLMTETSRLGRKARVSKYLGWFEQALMKDKLKDQKLTLNNEPLTMADCKFLQSIFVSARDGNQTVLDLTSLSKEDIQGYGLVFKVLDDLPDEQWTELETILAGAKN